MTGTVQVLDGGEVLLKGPAIADVRRALRLADRLAAHDGIRLSPVTRRLLTALDEATKRADSAAGTAEVPPDVENGHLEIGDEVGTREAARIMNTTDRNVRGLCARGSLATARLTYGRWVIDRAEVLHRSEQRKRP